MGSSTSVRLAVALAAVSSLAAAPRAAAQAVMEMMAPGSVLIFPVIDFGGPSRTIISITNLNTSEVVCGGGFRRGDVNVYFQFRDATNCLVFDRIEALTPGDTFSFRADEFDPVGTGANWLYVEARDPGTGRPIDFDFLLGSANFGELRSNLKWWYGAYAFKSRVSDDGAAFGTSPCGHAFVDPADDGFADFDGVEYAGFPRRVLLDFFVGEGQPAELTNGTIVSSRIVLMSPATTPTTVTMILRNNNETAFSRLFQFTCQFESNLSAIDSRMTESQLRAGYDPTELGGLPYGWFALSGSNGILGVFVQRAFRPDETPIQAFGRPLHFEGVRTDVRLQR